MKKAKTLFVLMFFMCLTSLSLFAQYDSSPDSSKWLPSVIWAAASGGGTWYSELQIWAETSGTQVRCYFDYDGGTRGPFTLFTSSGVDDCYRTTNILNVLSALDPTFTYYGRSGGMQIYSTGGEDIQVMARTYHSGGYAKTMNAVSDVDGTTASYQRWMMIMNVMKSSTFRTSITLYSLGPTCTVWIQIIQNNAPIASFSRSMNIFDYKAFDVFAEAGLTGTYYNCFVLIWTADTGGSQGRILCGGATVRNSTNDPAYHAPVGWW